MDVTVPRELRDRAATEPPGQRRDESGSRSRTPRSTVVRTGVIALVAAFSGAAAGAVVADHRDARASASIATSRGAFGPAGAAAVVAAVAPAIVSVRTRPANVTSLFSSTVPAGVGTGVVVGSDGTILTAAAVVPDAGPVTVTLADGRSYPAAVVGRDRAAGIAVLKIAAAGLAVAPLADVNRLRVGDDVVALADALAYPGGPIVSRGVVGALPRSAATSAGTRPTDLLQVTMPLTTSNTGGPIVDARGDVVGIAVPHDATLPAAGYAVDVVRAGPVIRELAAGQPVADTLGVDSIDVTPVLARAYGLAVESGALVASIVPGSPAATAGLRRGDIVVRFGHQRIATAEDLVRGSRDPSVDLVQLSVLRGRQPLSLTVRLAR